MLTISFFLFVIIKVSMCCNDIRQIKFLPPLQNVGNIQLNSGQLISIVCCHPDGADSLSWHNKLRIKIQSMNSEGLFSFKDEKDRLILRIDNIDQSKLGEYTCSNNKRQLSKTIMLSMRTSKLSPEMTKKKLVFPNNKPIHIRCPLTQNQGFNNWMFTQGDQNVVVNRVGGNIDYEVSEEGRMYTLKINNKGEKIKVLWCQYNEVAVNGDIKTGVYEFTWTLYDPIDTQLVIDHKGPILEGNDVSIICSFLYDEMLSIRFPKSGLKSNMVIDNNNVTKGRVVLTINKITKDQEGEYECMISKILNPSPFTVAEESVKVKVTVTIPPTIIKDDYVTTTVNLTDDVYLRCQIKSNGLQNDDVYFEYFQRENFTWVKIFDSDDKYGVNLTKNGINILTLLIRRINWEERGKYRCVAKNAAGEDSNIQLLKVKKNPELKSSTILVSMATKPVKIVCSVFGYPISSSENKVELRLLSEDAPLGLNVISRQNNDVDELSVSYDVVNQGELKEGSLYKLECYHQNIRSNVVKRKPITVRIAKKPSIPDVSVVCSGSSGIVFTYKVPPLSEDENKRMTKYILSYAPSEEFDSLTRKPFIVIPIKEKENKENLIYVLKELVASRKYTFKWESFNVFEMSNDQILTYSTKDLSYPRTPKMLQFLPKENVISVNITWQDECPYAGSNSPIGDIVVNMKPLVTHEGKRSNWQWAERNFTLEPDKSSAQFLIDMEYPQIDYEIQVALRSPQGTSPSLTGIYIANDVLTGSLFSCFPRCPGNTVLLSRSLFYSLLVLLFMYTMSI